MMTIVLSAKGCGNKKVTVTSFAEASSAWNKFRNENDFGSRDLMKTSGRLERDGRVIGHVSYNGRVWDTDGNELKD